MIFNFKKNFIQAIIAITYSYLFLWHLLKLNLSDLSCIIMASDPSVLIVIKDV